MKINPIHVVIVPLGDIIALDMPSGDTRNLRELEQLRRKLGRAAYAVQAARQEASLVLPSPADTKAYGGSTPTDVPGMLMKLAEARVRLRDARMIVHRQLKFTISSPVECKTFQQRE